MAHVALIRVYAGYDVITSGVDFGTFVRCSCLPLMETGTFWSMGTLMLAHLALILAHLASILKHLRASILVHFPWVLVDLAWILKHFCIDVTTFCTDFGTLGIDFELFVC